MVQVLPAAPTFLEWLGPSLFQLGQAAGQHYAGKKRAAQDQQILQQLENPQLSPIQKIALAGKLSPEKGKVYSSLLAPMLKQQEKGQQEQNILNMLFGSSIPGAFGGAGQVQDQAVAPNQMAQAESLAPMQQMAEQNVPSGTLQQQKQPNVDLSNPSSWPDDLLVKARGLSKAQGPLSIIGGLAEGEWQRREAQRKQDLEQTKSDVKERRETHKESANYDEEIIKSAKRARQQLEAVKDIQDALKTGKVNPGSVSSIFKNLGTVGDKIANGFKNAQQGKVDAAIPFLLEGWKDVFGVRLSDSDLNLLLQKLPDISKNKEANEAVLGIIEKYAQDPIMRAEIASEIKKKTGGYRPLNFADQIEEEFVKRKEQKAPVRIKAPNGKIYNVPKNQQEAALSAGGTLVQ